jgi:type II pantothenate kinase
MPPTRDRHHAAEIGIDAGASLMKLAIRDASGASTFECVRAGDLDAVAGRCAAAGRLALTGGGAARLARRLDSPAARVAEFEAWGAGARVLAAAEGVDPERLLVVSVGTGTSALLATRDDVQRVGGTALGGGTVIGLGAALVGTSDFDALTKLARSGNREKVDLLVRDIYPDETFDLPPQANAASFGKLAHASETTPADRADAIMGMVGETIGILASALASAHDVHDVFFGGGALRENPRLSDTTRVMCLVRGFAPLFPRDGAYAGAIGALERSAA